MAREFAVVQPLPSGDHAPMLRGDPSEWLPSPRQAGPGRWRIQLRVGGLRRTVLCGVGTPWRTPEGLQRRLTWTPLPEDADVLPVERMLPVLDGELHLVGGTMAPSLALVGEVDVPLGRFGEVVDALVLGRVAHRGAATFLQEVSARLATSTQEVAAHQRS